MDSPSLKIAGLLFPPLVELLLCAEFDTKTTSLRDRKMTKDPGETFKGSPEVQGRLKKNHFMVNILRIKKYYITS